MIGKYKIAEVTLIINSSIIIMDIAFINLNIHQITTIITINMTATIVIAMMITVK